jgi:hypothetical protein
MSAGHKHKTPNLLVPGPQTVDTLHRLLNGGDAPELAKRWARFDFDYDIPYLAGYNVQGTTRYGDRDFVRALYDPAYAEQLVGAPIDTGLSPENTLACILRHESTEKIILDADNPIDLYDHHDEPGGFGAHEYATVAEHESVMRLGGTAAKYERGLAPIIHFCEHKPIDHVPRDLCCAPYLDDPDENEAKIIKRFRELGVLDAFKVSKETVDYSKSTGPDHCAVCEHWQGKRGLGLTTCQIVEGLVRDNRWCTKFTAVENTNGKADSTRPPEPAEV